MLESDLDEINIDFLQRMIISFNKPEINYNKAIDKLELSIPLNNIRELKESCLNTLTNLESEIFTINYIFYIFIGAKNENKAIHRIKGTNFII